MNRHGVTFIELMIALAILVTMAALAAPILFNELKERAFQRSMDTIERQLLLARAEAQLRSETIEVVYQSDPPRLIVRRENVGSEGRTNAPTDPGIELQSFRPSRFRAPAEDDEAVIGVRELSRGVSVTLTDPVAPIGSDAAPGGDLLLAAVDRTSTPAHEQYRLLMYVPDGSALLARRFWLIDEDDRQARIDVNPWTGQPRATRLPPRGFEPVLSDDTEAFRADDEAVPEWLP